MPPDAFLPASDVFGYDAPLAWRLDSLPFGVPLLARTNHQRALALIAAGFGPWRDLDPALADTGPAARFDVVVHNPPGHIAAVPERPGYRWHGDVYLAVAGAQMLHVDVARAHATCFVTEDLLDWPDWFAWHVNGAAVLAATYGRRLPLHTATVVRDGLALLLHGRSGTGKSTLTYALTRLGWQVLNDDTQFVSPQAPARLWGLSTRLTLLPDAVRWFPELADQPPQRLANGKCKLVVPLPEPPRLCWTGARRLCLLRRGARFGLEPVATPEGLDLLLAADEAGFDRFRELHTAGRQALADLPCTAVTLPPDPVAAAWALDRAATGWQPSTH